MIKPVNRAYIKNKTKQKNTEAGALRVGWAPMQHILAFSQPSPGRMMVMGRGGVWGRGSRLQTLEWHWNDTVWPGAGLVSSSGLTWPPALLEGFLQSSHACQESSRKPATLGLSVTVHRKGSPLEDSLDPERTIPHRIFVFSLSIRLCFWCLLAHQELCYYDWGNW